MKNILPLILFLLITNQATSKMPPGTFSRDLFYKTLVSKDLKQIDQQLEYIKVLPPTDQAAFEGALLMKKSGLIINKEEKLKLVKLGKNKLEASILKDPKNCEYRFLRLIIQENAPKFLGYNKNIKEDCTLIKKEYPNTSKVLKKNILEFSKNSLNLRLSS